MVLVLLDSHSGTWYYGPMTEPKPSRAIKLVLSEDNLQAIESARGEVPRERWIKALLKGAVEAREAHGGPCLLRVVAEDVKPGGRE